MWAAEDDGKLRHGGRRNENGMKGREQRIIGSVRLQFGREGAMLQGTFKRVSRRARAESGCEGGHARQGLWTMTQGVGAAALGWFQPGQQQVNAMQPAGPCAKCTAAAAALCAAAAAAAGAGTCR